jgi:hypothetical protein
MVRLERFTPITDQLIFLMIRLIAGTTSPAALEGRSRRDFLIATPQGMIADKLVGMARGVRGWSANATQIGNFLLSAHATSMPMKIAKDTTQTPLIVQAFERVRDKNYQRRSAQMTRP